MKTTPKDFFLYIAAMVTLYVSAGSLLALLFDIVNAVFPDPLSYSDFYSSGIRFAIASLIIIFPVYISLSWILRKDVLAHPEKKELGIRRWLIYLTLFVAGAVVVGDLIALLNTFLGGEITVRFIAKVLSVFIVSGAIFAYYFYDLKRPADGTMKASRGLVIVACVFVLAVLVWGFTVMGSPSTARAMKFDERRVSDLQSIQWQLVNYWQQKGSIPASLEDLNDPISGFVAPIDPDTNESYTYKKTGYNAFNLCATFSRDTKSLGSRNTVEKPYSYPVNGMNENWQHPSGEYCFERTIDVGLYPVLPAKR